MNSFDIVERSLKIKTPLTLVERNSFLPANIPTHASLREFLSDLFLKYNSNYYVSNRRKYTDSNNSIRRRTILDIYRLCKRYYPASLYEIYNALCQLTKENIIGSFICHNLSKRVWGTGWNIGSISSIPFDEYGLPLTGLITLYNIPNDDNAMLHGYTGYGFMKNFDFL